MLQRQAQHSDHVCACECVSVYVYVWRWQINSAQIAGMYILSELQLVAVCQ